MFRSASIARRRHLALALGTSALGLLLPSALHAQCAPDPASANDAVSCAGSDTDGIRLTASGIALTVEEGASVSATGTSAITVDVPVGDYGYRSAAINVRGGVVAAGQNAITVWSGTSSPDTYYGTQYVTLAIGADGSVSGASALALLPSADNSNGVVVASVDNAGTLTGTGGTALLGEALSSGTYPSPLASFDRITNRATGRIEGGIVGTLHRLDNAGLIDGGAGSAVNNRAPYSSLTIANAAGGTIRSASGDATILNEPSQYLAIDNAGTIANMGGGAALSGDTLTLTNQVGAAIEGDVVAAGSLNLVNRGSIAGNIVAASGGNVIDSSAGVVDGSVSLGADNNRLIARYVGNRTLATGISGTISAAGTGNAQHVIFASDASVTTPIDLASGFQQLVLAPDSDVTVTLEAGFSPISPLLLSGSGAVVNRATMSLAGAGIADLDYDFGSSMFFRNEGVIDIALAGVPYGAGVRFGSHSFVNDGTLRVDGGAGIDMSSNPVVNSGTIIASGTGATLVNGVLTNSGTIASTTGVGVMLNGNVGYTSANSGTISGATTGADTGIYLTNSGTINGGEVGVAVQPYGYLINAAGGIVNGGTVGAVTVGPFNSGIANAGTINGNVAFDAFGSSINRPVYFALPGGMLNGDLALYEATLVTDLINTGPGQFAGIAGTVTASSDATLRYVVHADASATLPAGDVGPFRNLEYQLDNDAALTLTASDTRTQTLALAGKGRVDLNADIAVAGGAAIRSADMLTYPGMAQPATGLSITSRGNLAITRTNDNAYYSGAAVLLSSTDDFVNEGDISVTDRLGYDTAGIAGGASIVNRGRILLDGGVGISVTADTINAGAITQIADGAVAKGATVYSGSFDNQGMISVGGSAVQLGGYYSPGLVSLINGGTLLSMQGAAITATETSYGIVKVRNLAGGVITGTGGTAILLSGGTLSNAGTIDGDIDLSYMPNGYGNSRGVYVADGGILDGSLSFGRGDDIFVQTGDDIGVTGTITGGEGDDLYARIYQADATTLLGGATRIGFERDYLGTANGATVTIDAAATSTDMLFVGGEGTIINLATLDGAVTSEVLSYYFNAPTSILSGSIGTFVNRGALNGGLDLGATSIVNEGTIGAAPDRYGISLRQYAQQGALRFTNSGRIVGGDRAYAVDLSGVGLSELRADNSGLIDGNVSIFAQIDPAADGDVVITNSGTIRADTRPALSIANSSFFDASGGRYSLTNSGLIETNAPADAAIRLSLGNADVTIVNEGTLRNSGAGYQDVYYDPWADRQFLVTAAASTVQLEGYGTTTLTLTNAADGTIEAADDLATAILTRNAALTLDNAGTIRGSAGTVLADDDWLAFSLGQTMLAGAIQTIGDGADSVVNSGTIIGSIDLGAGDDVIVNRGTIIGDVHLGDGDDSFTQAANAVVQGIVDGGAGTDSFIVDATGGGAINADQFVNFERFFQIGTGDVAYSGAFSFDTIGLDGGTVIVAAGETLSSSSTTTITGGAGKDSVRNDGTIAGGIDLGAGDDAIVNGGVIAGPVMLGAGNDSFTEKAGSRVAGHVDGGEGTDLYRVLLAGDRSGVGAHVDFEQLSVEGQGTLTLTLDQGYERIDFAGTGLDLTTDGHFVGRIAGSDGQERLRLTGDVSHVNLGGGDDALVLDLIQAAGRYDGGTGDDRLRFTVQGPVTLAGTATGFERIDLAGKALVVTGQLGSTDGALRFGDAGYLLDIAAGGRLLGRVDMGSGDDVVRLADGALWQGTLSGGAGYDSLFLGMAGARTLDGDRLTGFEALTTQGGGALTLANGFALDRLHVDGDLILASGASLATNRLSFGGSDRRFTINGLFAGAIDGGNARILLDAGSAATPVRFANVDNIGGLVMNGGTATVSGNADFSAIDMRGGRLVGLAGSTIRAATIKVGRPATFGSAGHVIGNVDVAGTLSPGASPGTMTVTGNVALANGSTTVMEVTPTVSDRLAISGTLTIAQGASLVLSAEQPVRPGTTLDLITAAGGISGSYGTIVRSPGLFGVIVQDANRIGLLGQFLNNAGFTPQVRRAIDYTNAVIAAGTASESLIDGLPVLAIASGASNAAAFARLTAEPYAAATQLGVENGLTIAQAGRGIAHLSADDAPRAFGIAQYLGGLGRIAADDRAGLSASRSRSHGLLGGLGLGTDRWSLAGFGGMSDARQTLRPLGSRTDADGWFAGVAGSYALGALRFDATLAYQRLDADTQRVTPDGGKAQGRFRLNSWIGDLSLSYEAALGDDWAVRPDIGLSYIATSRSGLREEGGNGWALDVGKDKHDALFADGGIGFARSRASDAPFRPFVRLGLQYQLQGRGVEALAGFAGSDRGLLSLGSRRAGLVGSVAGGAEMRVSARLSLFANAAQTYSEDDRRASANVGLKLNF